MSKKVDAKCHNIVTKRICNKNLVVAILLQKAQLQKVFAINFEIVAKSHHFCNKENCFNKTKIVANATQQNSNIVIFLIF